MYLALGFAGIVFLVMLIVHHDQLPFFLGILILFGAHTGFALAVGFFLTRFFPQSWHRVVFIIWLLLWVVYHAYRGFRIFWSEFPLGYIFGLTAFFR